MRLPEPILVTGGTGFFGRHLVSALRAQGYNVDLTGGRHADLTDEMTARRSIQAARVRTVFHLAAMVGGIGANRAKPWTFWDRNLRMGLNVLSASLDGIVEVLVVSGTVCCYPLSPPIPFKEESLWDGFPEPTNAPYGIAKRALQTGLQAASAERGLRYAFPIPTNLFGPGEHFDLHNSHVIPALIRKFEDARESGASEVVLWGSGKPSRDFLYVADGAEAFILAGEHVVETGENIDAMNLSSGKDISISDLARMVKAVTGYKGQVVWDTSMPDGQPKRLVDHTRATTILGWKPKTELLKGISTTVAWYRDEVKT